MQLQAKRISILEQENSLSIVIFSYRNNFKTTLMAVWVILFTLCGILAIKEFRMVTAHDKKIFWLVFTSFWIYFELVMLKAFLWRLKKKKKIILTKDIIKIQRYITGLEPYKEYRCEQAINWRRTTFAPGSMVNVYENAYWYVGGESITFDYFGSEVKIAVQLPENETSELLGKVKYFLLGSQ